jgi:large subunit ribosomal protein L23
MHPIHILKHLRLTEKSNKLSSELGQYTFEVDIKADKGQIRRAVEETFKVTVRRVNTMIIGGKPKRTRQGGVTARSDYKKAIVTLKAGDKIELT